MKILLYIAGGLLLIVLGIIIVLWIKSPGKTEATRDAEGRILTAGMSGIEKVNIGNIDQYLIIRGADTAKPVMLFLHGGPGSPEFSFMKEMNPSIGNDFLMVYWEQRGSGKSFSKNIPGESMTMEQMVSDTRELSEMLCRRFNRDKIYLAGHSWGSLLGIKTAYRYPELYHAFIGIGQVAHQYRAEKLSFEWIREQAEKSQDDKALGKINGLIFPDSLATSAEWKSFLMPERRFVNKYGGGTTRDMTSMWPAVKIVLRTKEYTLGDKINYGRGNMYSLDKLWSDVINTNLFNSIDSMEVPVYIFQGIHDYQTPYLVAKEFFEQLKAPEKNFYTFENAAHSPVFENPDRFNEILRTEVLKKQESE
ncbi:MAG: alpha/beta hydrolase [Bacteroidales bacterium]